MPTTNRQRTHHDVRRFQPIFELELARGVSVIASTLTDESRQKAIAEIFEEVVQAYGETHLNVFGELLAYRLSEGGDTMGSAAEFRRIHREPFPTNQ
jgi:hypothetical protein